MIAGVLLQLATGAAPPVPPAASWPALPALPFRATPVVTPDVTRFVRAEVESGRCNAAVRDGTGVSLHVDLAVLTAEHGHIRRVTPLAIRCPAVEQYAAGLLTGLARDNVAAEAAAGGWYRTSLTFSWTQ